MNDFDDMSENESAQETTIEQGGVNPDANQATGADNADAPKEKVVFSEEQQAIFNSEIQKKAVRVAEEREKRRQVEAELAELRKQIPEKQAPTVPPLPNADLYLDDEIEYQRQMQQREAALFERAKFMAANEERERLENQRLQQQQIEQQQEAARRQMSYIEKAQSYGIESQQLQQDAQIVGNAVSQDVGDYLASDEQGPLIVGYLAKNPLVLDELLTKSPFEVGSFLSEKVKPKLAGAKTKTAAPKPADIVKGGAPDTKEAGLEGVVFS